MKKTITITIGGRAFTIEEDGYLLLDGYLQKIKRTFSIEGSVDELIADMEMSIGEKMQERISKQNAVITKYDVEQIIDVMGQPEEIAEDQSEVGSQESRVEQGQRDKGAEGQKSSDEEDSAKKRLYRDTDDVVIAGVASGLGAYLGLDPVIVRLAFILLTFMNGIGILIYLALWVSVPKAETTIQKYEMRGKAIDLHEIQETLKEKSRLVAEEGKAALERMQEPESNTRRFVDRIFDIFRAIGEGIVSLIRHIGPIILGVIGIVLLIASALAIAGTITAGFLALLNPSLIVLISEGVLAPFLLAPNYMIGIISALLVALIPLIFLLMLGATFTRRKNTFGTGLSAILMIVWIASAVMTVLVFAEIIPQLSLIYT